MTDRYFDHAATTPLDPHVFEAMLPWMREHFGNAHSLHHWGRKADGAVERAREQVARLFGADDPAQIIFTSGATEANNWALSTSDRIAISPFEHSAVREPGLQRGAEILANDRWTLASPDRDPEVISVMAVNNETGAILFPPTHTPRTHIDAVQALGKTGWKACCDFASASAHKIYGPKGIGALYARNPYSLDPFIRGGEQEHGLRGGTLNVPGIVGFGEAAKIAFDRQEEDHQVVTELREIVLEEMKGLGDIQTNDAPNQSPFILSLSFAGIEGETLVIEMDAEGYGISAGAACSSRSTEPSHVLTALSLPENWLRGTVRISFGRSNTPTSALALARLLRQKVEQLR